MSITVTRKVHFSTGLAGQKRLRKGTAATIPGERVPMISRLMALAIHFDQLIRAGKVRDHAELARLGHVTRARVTQIMTLLALAPDIQEAILLLEPTVSGRDAVRERDLRKVVAETDWRKQRVCIDPIVVLARLGCVSQLGCQRGLGQASGHNHEKCAAPGII